MKDKLSQIQQRMRGQTLELYFRQRRMQLLAYRQRPSTLSSSQDLRLFNNQSNSWRYMVLNGIKKSDEEAYCEQLHRGMGRELNFEINITSVQAGQYYYNILIDGAAFNYLQQTVCLLGKLVNKLLAIGFKLTLSEQKNLNRMLIKILRQINDYLKIGQQLQESRSLCFGSGGKTKRVLMDLLEDDYRLLFQKEDSGITSQIINLAYELCSSYLVYPNYQVIRYILTRVVTKENWFVHESEEKRDNREGEVNFGQKMEQLLMKFIIFFRLEESSNRKSKNVHHLQLVHEYYSLIEFNLVNIYQFVRNNEHPFDYEHVNNNLYFTLTLFTEVIGKFKGSLRGLSWEQPNVDVLVKQSIIDQIYNITYLHSRSAIFQREKDEFILTIEETVFKVFRYVLEEKSKSRLSHPRYCGMLQQMQMHASDQYLLDVLMLIKGCLSQSRL